MLIFYSSTSGDPLLLDSPERLREFDSDFRHFLESSSPHASFPAIPTGDPAPYSELLRGLRVVKHQGLTQLCLADDHWLELSGSVHDLLLLSKALSGLNEGDHHHWYTSPSSLIIEADESRADSENFPSGSI